MLNEFVNLTRLSFQLLEELCSLGSDPNFVCSKPAAKTNDTIGANNIEIGRATTAPVGNEAGSSDEEEDEDDDTATATPAISIKTTTSDAKTPVPLVDYILNVVSF